MGLLEFLFGRHASKPPRAEAVQPSMRLQNPSWIRVTGSSAAAIQQAILEYSQSAAHAAPTTVEAKILRLDSNHFAVVFEPSAPPYAFTNLINWLSDPNMTQGAEAAAGWLASPGSGRRYYLAPDEVHAGGDTLLGVDQEGRPVSVYLPDGAATYRAGPVPTEAEPALPTAGYEPDLVFEVALDADRSFGNPEFVVGQAT